MLGIPQRAYAAWLPRGAYARRRIRENAFLADGPSLPRIDAHATRLRRLRRNMAEDSSPARPSKLPGSGMAEMLSGRQQSAALQDKSRALGQRVALLMPVFCLLSLPRLESAVRRGWCK